MHDAPAPTRTLTFGRRLAAATLAAALVATAHAAALVSDAVVDADWLEAHLDDPTVRVFEVSVQPGQFERGHVPGAVNLVWHTDLVDPVVRDIVPADRFEAQLRAAGVNADTTVVLYGDNSNWFAAWGAWIFEVYGVADVRLLDGGRASWEAQGRPLSARPTAYAEGTFEVVAPRPELRARLADVLDVVEGRADAQIVDIRSPAEYEGRVFAPEGVQELAIRAGHIPGAVNVPWSQAVRPDGTFKSREELEALYGAVGVDGARPVIVYCRIGERSSHTWFVLSRILGYEVRQYDGSWTEWGNTVGVPITNLAGTVWGGR